MKVALLTYSCDHNNPACGAESPHEPTWAQARREAKKAGWQFAQTNAGERHYCPDHKADR